MLPFLLQCLVLLKRITSDCQNLTQSVNGNHSTATSPQFDHRNTLHLCCTATVMMASLGTQIRPFSCPPSLTCLNFNHHDLLCTLKTNVPAELSSSAALFLLTPVKKFCREMRSDPTFVRGISHFFGRFQRNLTNHQRIKTPKRKRQNSPN